MSIQPPSKSNQVYSDQYGNTKSVETPSSDLPEDVGLEEFGGEEYELMVEGGELTEGNELSEGDEFIDGETALDPKAITEKLQSLTQLAKDNGIGGKVLQEIEDKKGLLLRLASYSPEKQAEEMAALGAALGEIEAAIQTEIELAPAKESLRDEIKSLEKMLSDTDLGEDVEEAFEDRIEGAQKALKDNPDLTVAEEMAMEVKSDLEAAVEEVKAQKAEEGATREEKLTELEKSLKDSSIPGLKKSELQGKIDELKARSQEEGADHEALLEEIETLGKAVQREITVQGLRDSMAGFENKIPKGTYTKAETAALYGSLFRIGMETGVWNHFEGIFMNSDMDETQRYDILRKILGTIFYGPAGKNEAKFEQYLDMMPAGLRQRMVGVLTAGDFRYDSRGSETSEQQQINFLYGENGAALAARLQESLVKDNLSDEPSPPPAA